MLARTLGGAVVLGVMTHVALAQTVAEQDLKFAKKAAEGGLMEVQFGELAQQQAKDEMPNPRLPMRTGWIGTRARSGG